MARIRSLHPGVATDEDLVTVSRDARLFYLLLLTECDDQGVFEWKPVTLKMRLFPADSIDVEPLLAELVRANKVAPYEIECRKYGAVRNFRKWQRPKSPNSIHPIVDQVRSYVGLSAPISEIDEDERPPIPPNAEKSPQMEEVGDKRKDVEDSEAKASGADAPKPVTPIDLKAELWRVGKSFLMDGGRSKKDAGSILGAWRNQYGDQTVLDVMAACQVAAASDPVAWITKALKRRGRGPVNGTGPPKKPLGPAAGTPEFDEQRRRAGI